MTETNNTKLTQKKWFKWTLGISGVAVVALAITLPIVLLSGDSGRKQLETKQEVWSIQKTNDSYTDTGWWGETSEQTQTPQAKNVIDNLSKNTTYFGWYSTTDYRGSQEFKDYQAAWTQKILNSIEYSTKVIENLPTLPDNPTQQQLEKFNLEVTEYTATVDETATFSYVLNDAENAFELTTFANDFGTLTTSYYSNSDSGYYIFARYSGSIEVTQAQIDSGSEDLPEVYQFNQEILSAWTKTHQTYYSWLDETYKGFVTEEVYNKLPITDKPSYDEAKAIYVAVSESLLDIQITNIII